MMEPNASLTLGQQVIAIIAAFIAGGGLIKLFEWYSNRAKDRRSQYVEDRAWVELQWRGTIDDLKTEVRSMRSALTLAETRIRELSVEHATCLEREATLRVHVAELRTEISSLTDNMRRMQARVGDSTPGTIFPTLITAEVDGTILTVGGGITPLLHYLPRDLIGKNVDTIIPEHLREQHTTALAKLRDSHRHPDPAKTILTYALNKEGEEIPVAINLSGGGQSRRGLAIINAEIRKRASGEESCDNIPAVSVGS